MELSSCIAERTGRLEFVDRLRVLVEDLGLALGDLAQEARLQAPLV